MTNAIEVKNLCKSYGNFKLDNVSFTLPSGCIMGLAGENGAGKSTTIKLLLNTIKKERGEIRLLEKNYTVSAMDDIGVVTDENCLPECMNACEINSVFKNIYKNWDQKLYFGYLKQFEIPLNKKIKAYSKGMKMKLNIITALAHDAKLLILDEATSSLDPVMRDEILDILNDFTSYEDHSVLISSHIVSDLEKICDYIAFMHKGKLLLCEEKDELLNHYCIVQCDENTLASIDKNSILSIRKSGYSLSAVVKKSAVDDTIPKLQIGLEDLFIYMIRGQKQ